VTIADPRIDYRCDTCRKRYRRPDPKWSCCVLHLPSECCHFGEVRITKHGKPKDRHRAQLVNVSAPITWTFPVGTNTYGPRCTCPLNRGNNYLGSCPVHDVTVIS